MQKENDCQSRTHLTESESIARPADYHSRVDYLPHIAAVKKGTRGPRKLVAGIAWLGYGFVFSRCVPRIII